MTGLDVLLPERRNDIVSALSGLPVVIDGRTVNLSAFTGQPSTVDRLQAWPVWVNAVPYTSCLAETYWQVLVTLPPADQLSMIETAAAVVNTVADALLALGSISAIRPAQIPVADGAAVPAVQFEISI